MVGEHLQDAAEAVQRAVIVEHRHHARFQDLRGLADDVAVLAIDRGAAVFDLFRHLAQRQQVADPAVLGLHLGDPAIAGIAPADGPALVGQEQGRPEVHQLLLEYVA